MLVVLLAPVPDAAQIALVWVIALGLLFAIGHVQAHIALNGDLDDHERMHWRIAVVMVPGTVAYSWHLYVR